MSLGILNPTNKENTLPSARNIFCQSFFSLASLILAMYSSTWALFVTYLIARIPVDSKEPKILSKMVRRDPNVQYDCHIENLTTNVEISSSRATKCVGTIKSSPTLFHTLCDWSRRWGKYRTHWEFPILGSSWFPVKNAIIEVPTVQNSSGLFS